MPRTALMGEDGVDIRFQFSVVWGLWEELVAGWSACAVKSPILEIGVGLGSEDALRFLFEEEDIQSGEGSRSLRCCHCRLGMPWLG